METALNAVAMWCC